MNVSLLEDKADNLQLMAAGICLMTVVGRDHSYIEKSIHRLYIYIYIIYIYKYYERKKRRNYISQQACFVNRFTLQGFNERIFMRLSFIY